MGYQGSAVPIPLGQLGLHTDDPMNQLPPNAAITANNISLFTSRVEKSRGSQPYQNMAALSAGVVGVFDWLPQPTSQRLIALTSDGKVWRDSGDGTFGTATPIKTGLGTLTPSCHMVSGGVEEANRNKKLFIYTSGVNKVQVIDGDVATTRDIKFPNTDWATGNYPTFGFIFQGRQFLFGSANNPHTLYWSGAAEVQNPQNITTNATTLLTGFTDTSGIQVGSVVTGTNIFAGSTVASLTTTTVTLSHVTTGSATVNDIKFTPVYFGQDHENFVTPALNEGAASAGSQNVFSGEGDGLIGAFVYKGAAILFKRPFGVYVLNFSDSLNYTLTKYSDAFGLASPHGACQVVDDLIAGNNAGSLTSLKATQAYGAFETGDVLNNARVRDYVRTNTDVSGLQTMHSCYYPEKEVAYFTTRVSNSSANQDRMIVLDVSRNTSRISIETKDQPSCLALRRDTNNVLRPMYGSADGKVYLMDQSEHSVGTSAYVGEFQTPYIDFSYLDASMADKVKLFDFLTVSYIGVGAWSFYIDVYVDGAFVETIPYAMSSTSALGSFTLDLSRLGSNTPQTLRKPMHCAGKSVSFRIYNGVASQYFKIDKIIVSFRLSAEQNKSSK